MEFNPIASIVLLCGIMTVVLAIYAWRHRSTNGAQTFAIFMASVAIYILGYCMEIASPDLSTMLFWSKIQYIGILTFPTVYMVFVVQYTGREIWLTPRNLSLVLIIPIALIIVKFLDDDLHLIYASAEVDRSGAIPLLSFTRGPLYLVVVMYNLLMVTLGVYLLVQKRRFASYLYRKQTTVMVVAALIIYLVYGVYLSGITLFPTLKNLDLNPFVYTLWGGAIGLTIFRYRLFDLAPIARDALIERLSDGVIVLDVHSRLVDANPEAQKIFGWRQPPVGEVAETITNNWINRAFLNAVEVSTRIETHLTRGTATIYYEVTVSTLEDKQGQKIGYLIVVHDVTERKEVEERLRELSLVDELTGLTNRRGFRILATQLIGMTNRMNLNAVLFYMDMDGLKQINDKLGHATGDQALKDSGDILKTSFRSSDIVARFGGDEFVILAIESAENTGEFMLKRLQDQFNAYNAENNRNYKLSFSIGQSRYQSDNPGKLESLIEEADKAMYGKKLSK